MQKSLKIFECQKGNAFLSALFCRNFTEMLDFWGND